MLVRSRLKIKEIKKKIQSSIVLEDSVKGSTSPRNTLLIYQTFHAETEM